MATTTETVNAAMLEVKVPDVSAQKQEFFKAGVRALVKQIQLQLQKENK
jgi:hypothetical protein